MLIKEFRVVLPISVEEYQVGKLYSVAEVSKTVTGGGEGVQVLVNEPYEEDGEKGQYTHKMYHIKHSVPKILSMVMPKGSMVVHEKAWNTYPYTRTILSNEYMKDNFYIKIETWHRPDMGEEDNVHGLDAEEWKNVEVVHIDIADKNQVQKTDYKAEADPATFRSAKTKRGPLRADWQNLIAKRDSAIPHMCAYKLVTVHFKWLGLQSNVEAYFLKRQRRVFTLFNRQLFCWIDRWFGLTMEQIRLMEDETQKDLAELIEKGDYRGLIGLGDD